MISYKNLISAVLDQIDRLLVDYVQDGYQALVAYLKMPLGAAIVLFFVCYGISISQGWIKGSVAGLTHSLFKIGVIYFLAMNWSNFSFYIYDLFYKVSSEIGSAILLASPVHFDNSDNLDINAALQMVLNEIWKVAQWIFEGGGLSNPGPWLGGIFVGAVGVFLIGLSLLEIVISKCMLSILFIVAPLFIAFTLFEATRSFFDRWLGACVGYASLMIFISASLGLILSLDYWIVDDMYNYHAENVTWINTGTVLLVTLICIGMVKRISLLALSIGGTVSTISGEESFATGVGALVSGGVFIKSAVNYVKGSSSDKNNNINNRDRYLKDNVSSKGNHSDHHSSAADRSRFVKENDHYDSSDHKHDSSFKAQDRPKHQQSKKQNIRFNINQSNNRKRDLIESDYD